MLERIESRVTDFIVLTFVVVVPCFIYTLIFLGFMTIPIFPSLSEVIRFYISEVLDRDLASVILLLGAAITPNWCYQYSFKAISRFLTKKEVEIQRDEIKRKCKVIAIFFGGLYIFIVRAFYETMGLFIEAITSGMVSALLVSLPILYLILSIQVFHHLEDNDNKKRSIAIANSGYAFIFFAAIVSMLSWGIIDDRVRLPQRENGVLQIWIDDTSEFLLSCRADSKGIIYVRTSVLSPSLIDKTAVSGVENAVEYSRLPMERAEAICKRSLNTEH